MAISLDNETGKVTVGATTATTRAKVGSVKVSVTLNGKTTSTIADVYQKAASASPSDPDPTPEEQNYTYQYSGNNYVTAKCYYKDTSGNLLEQPVPNSGGNACLVLDYSIGVNRYVDGVFVDEVAITYGATLEALSYATFADDDCDWWVETASDLSTWTHNLQYSIGEDVVRGASAVDITFGEAPVPFVTTEKFVAVQFSGIKLKLPAGILEGLGELTLECSDVASLEQEYRSYGNVTKVTWQISGYKYGFDGVNPGGTIDLTDKSDLDTIKLEIDFDTKCIAEFDSGHTEENNWYDSGAGLRTIGLYDYGEFSNVGTLEIKSRESRVYQALEEWTISEFKSHYLNTGTSIQTQLGMTISWLGDLSGKYSCEEVVTVDSVERSTSSTNLVYPLNLAYWYFKV